MGINGVHDNLIARINNGGTSVNQEGSSVIKHVEMTFQVHVGHTRRL